VVLKSVGPTAHREDFFIEMVLDLGGKHRTVAEFGEIARQSGLEVVAAARQPILFRRRVPSG